MLGTELFRDIGRLWVMVIKLPHYFALISIMVLGACSQTETAQTDEPDQSMLEGNTGAVEPATPSQKQAVINIATAQTEQPAPTKAPVPVMKTPTPNQAGEYVSPPPASVKNPESNLVTSARTPFRVKRCMNMGNALEAPNEGEWGYSIRQQDLQKIARAGFDTIRLPVRWDTHTANRAPYAIDAPFMARVRTVVAQAQTAGLGVIIDVHHFEKLMRQPKRQEARFLAMWTQIAETFKDTPSNVYLEILNQPTLELNMHEANALYAKVVPVIRATH
jgi:endoglucanase